MRTAQARYVDVVIGTDNQEEAIKHLCNEGELSKYSGANPGSPRYLTPACFQKEFQNKYHSQPEKSSMDDGHAYCGSFYSAKACWVSLLAPGRGPALWNGAAQTCKGRGPDACSLEARRRFQTANRGGHPDFGMFL